MQGRIGYWKSSREYKHVVRYGPLRYVGSLRYGWTDSQPNNLIWGYRGQGTCGAEKCREQLCYDTSVGLSMGAPIRSTNRWPSSQRPSWSIKQAWYRTTACPEPQYKSVMGIPGKDRNAHFPNGIPLFDPESTAGGRGGCPQFNNCENGKC